MSTDAITTIKCILKDTNKAWSSGRPEDLNQYFHDSIIIVSPDMKILGAGKELCIQSYIDFLNRATDIHFHDHEPEVHIFENTAIVFYTYDISWQVDGKQFQETGKELYVLNKLKGQWLIVMRQLMPAK